MKRLTALLLALLMVVSLCPTLSIHAHAADDCPIPGATGTGTETDPVVVDTLDELEKALVYEGTLHILLETDLSGIVDYNLCWTKGTKVLTVNSALHVVMNNMDSLITVGKSASLTVRGNGTLTASYSVLRCEGTLNIEGA